jgi:site-specific recombinase
LRGILHTRIVTLPVMKKLLERIAISTASNPDLLIALVGRLRPQHAEDRAQASKNLQELCRLLENSAIFSEGLRNHLLRIISSRKQSHLYSDTGIFDGTGFFTELRQRLSWKLLPPEVNDTRLRDIFGQLFNHRDDGVWIDGTDDCDWLRLAAALQLGAGMTHQPLLELLESITTLSHRLTSLGLDPHLIRVYPEIESYESPFLALNAEVTGYVRDYHEFLAAHRVDRQDERQALVLITQCRELLQRIRRRAPETGVSIRLTQLMVRMLQIMARMESLFRLLESTGEARQLNTIHLFKELVREDNRKFSLREVFATHTSLLALRVTENAGHAGEHYVTTSRRDYFAMLRSGLGAGFIIGFMALMKALAAKLSLAPIGAAFLFSLNYSLGFMLIHMLHFTVATKQPAMTAARIAAVIEEAERGRDSSLQALADLCVSVFRTQFIAIVGNVMLALPTALLLAWAWRAVMGDHLADPAKAQALLHELDPVNSLALFHAAIAGVCLFLAGLISGYYDNKALYNRIPERLRQRKALQQLLGEQRLYAVTTYLGNNLGALAGNFYFGIMLGSMSTIGFILGLPLDIRHITFSSANFGFALMGREFHLAADVLLTSIAGIAAIGLVNLSVSFGLALVVALRARGVRYGQWLPLLGMIGRRFLRSPLRFFWPPREASSSPPPVGKDEKKAA